MAAPRRPQGFVIDSLKAGAVVDARPDEAYADLFAGHFWGLVKLAHLLGADDPEDVVQDAFVRLHRRRGVLRDPHAALAYLRAIVCNLSRSRLRHLRMARRRHRELAPISDEWSAEHQAVLREDIRELLAGVRALPTRQREALVLRYWLDLSERETAERSAPSRPIRPARSRRSAPAWRRPNDGHRNAPAGRPRPACGRDPPGPGRPRRESQADRPSRRSPPRP